MRKYSVLSKSIILIFRQGSTQIKMQVGKLRFREGKKGTVINWNTLACTRTYTRIL
jgi:hypothetical protein